MKFQLAKDLQTAYLCFAIGVLGVLAFTWVHDRLLGPEFSPLGGILLNLFSFFVTLTGFIFAIRSMWADVRKPVPSISVARVTLLSLMATMLNGVWALFYVFVLIVPLLFGAY